MIATRITTRCRDRRNSLRLLVRRDINYDLMSQQHSDNKYFLFGQKSGHHVRKGERDAMTPKDTSALEHEIDELVYKLYGFTEKEIAIVEGATKR